MGLFSKKKTEDKVEKQTQDKVVKKESKDVNSLVSGGYGVIIRPIVTEKSHVMSQSGKYMFEVSFNANKSNVKEAVEEMYKVNVDKVNVSIVSNKKRTIKYDRGYQKKYKKAIVTLKEGQSITAFEGV